MEREILRNYSAGCVQRRSHIGYPAIRDTPMAEREGNDEMSACNIVLKIGGGGRGKRFLMVQE